MCLCAGCMPGAGRGYVDVRASCRERGCVECRRTMGLQGAVRCAHSLLGNEWNCSLRMGLAVCVRLVCSLSLPPSQCARCPSLVRW